MGTAVVLLALGAAFLLPAFVAVALIGGLGAPLESPAEPGAGEPAVLAGAGGQDVPSPAARQIPAVYLADFEASGARFGVPWGVLAGIYQLECDFGRSQLAGCNPPGSQNGAGAQGPGQFLAPTWRVGLSFRSAIPLGPPTTSDAQGFATDGDNDGVANPWDPADAIASTARMLAAQGAASGGVSGAVFAYNHSPTYVNQVLGLAQVYDPGAFAGGKTGGVIAGGPRGGPPPGQPTVAGAGPASLANPGGAQPASVANPSGASVANPSGAGVAAVLSYAQAQLGRPYQWGATGPGSFDCSGLVLRAFGAAGLGLPRTAAAQFAATRSEQVPLSAVQAGDLVFFGSSAPTISHVGIAISPTQMIDAPHTGAVVRIEDFHWHDLFAATDPPLG